MQLLSSRLSTRLDFTSSNFATTIFALVQWLMDGSLIHGMVSGCPRFGLFIAIKITHDRFVRAVLKMTLCVRLGAVKGVCSCHPFLFLLFLFLFRLMELAKSFVYDILLLIPKVSTRYIRVNSDIPARAVCLIDLQMKQDLPSAMHFFIYGC